VKAPVGGRNGWHMVRDRTGERAEDGSGWRVRVLDDVALLSFFPPEGSGEHARGVQVPLDLLEKLNGGPPASPAHDDGEDDYEAPPPPLLVVQPSSEPATVRFPWWGLALAAVFWVSLFGALYATGAIK
jgi:hypothetical protein